MPENANALIVDLFATRADPTSPDLQAGGAEMPSVYNASSGLISSP
jgi:hypothetical protein